MADEDDGYVAFDLRKPAPLNWLDRTPWAQFGLFGVLVVCIALPVYTSVPRAWAFAGALLVVTIVTGFGLLPTKKGGA